jgi:hypothetical protein
MAYDLDLRKRAVELIGMGHSCRIVGEMLGVRPRRQLSVLEGTCGFE